MKKEELRIKPSDLRLGNWVMYDNRYFQISMIADVFPELNTDEFGIGVVDYNNISAIPLSEEVLLKSGFKNEIDTSYFTCKKTRFTINLEGNLSNLEGHIGYKTCIWSNENIKHLHQLQNLYFSLTGEELEVKWS